MATLRFSMNTMLLLFLMCAVPVLGQSDLSILYSPMVLELAGERGQTVPFEITIMNQASFTTAHFRTHVAGLRERQDGVYVVREHDDWEYGASEWIEIDEEQFSVGPGEYYIVRGRVRIPRRSPGSGYATIITELVPENAPAGVDASTYYYQQFTTALEITVGQQHRRSAYISEFRIVPTGSDPRLRAAYGPNSLLFLASVTNDGDVHVRGTGQLIIRDMLGRRVRSVPLGSGRGVILPEATLDFGSVIRGLPAGTYEIETRINYGGHRPAVNRTTFELTEEEAGVVGSFGGRAMRVDASPSTIELSLQRQGYRAATVTVVNHDTVDVRFTLSADHLVHDVDGVPVNVSPSEEVPNSAREWVEIRPAEFVLRPGQRRNVVIGFQVPAEQQGGRYARVRIQAEPADPANLNDVSALITDLDVSVYLTLGTEHERRLELVDLDVAQHAGRPGFVVGIMARNTGNVHVPAAGRVTLLEYIPPREELVGDVIIQHDERWNGIEQVMADVTPTPLLPGENRWMQASFASPLKPRTQYRVIVELQQPTGPALMYRLDLWVDADGTLHMGNMPPENEPVEEAR